MTQNEQVLQHLQKGHALTALTALRLFSLLRLAARVRDLRAAGHDIRTTMEGSGHKRYAVYRLAK